MALSCCKKLSALFRGITSNNKKDFYCLSHFSLILVKISLKSIIMYVKIIIIVM